jgi:hypothetical protein
MKNAILALNNSAANNDAFKIAAAQQVATSILQPRLALWYTDLNGGEKMPAGTFPMLSAHMGSIEQIVPLAVRIAIWNGAVNTHLINHAVVEKTGIKLSQDDLMLVLKWLRTWLIYETNSATRYEYAVDDKIISLLQVDVRKKYVKMFEAACVRYAPKTFSTTPVVATMGNSVKKAPSTKGGRAGCEVVETSSYSKATPLVLEALQKLNDVQYVLNPAAAGLALKNKSAKSGKSGDKEHVASMGRFAKWAMVQKSTPFHDVFQCITNGRVFSQAGGNSPQYDKFARQVIMFKDSVPCDMDEMFIYAGSEMMPGKHMPDALHAAGKAAFEAYTADETILKSYPASVQTCFKYPDQAIGRADWATQVISLTGMMLNVRSFLELSNTTTNETGELQDFYTFAGALVGLDRDEIKTPITGTNYGQAARGVHAKMNEKYILAGSDKRVTLEQVESMFETLHKCFPEMWSIQNHVRGAFTEFAPKDFSEDACAFREEFANKITGFKTAFDEFQVAFESNVYSQIEIGKGYVSDKKLDFKVKIKSSKRFHIGGNQATLITTLVQAQDAAILREVVRRADFPISPIHDSFGVHFGHMKALRRLINEVTRDWIKTNPLNAALAQIQLYNDLDMPGFEPLGSPCDPELINNELMVRC